MIMSTLVHCVMYVLKGLTKPWAPWKRPSALRTPLPWLFRYQVGALESDKIHGNWKELGASNREYVLRVPCTKAMLL